MLDECVFDNSRLVALRFCSLNLSDFLVAAVGACLRILTQTHEAVVGIVRNQENNHWHQAYYELYSCDTYNSSQ